MTNIEVNQARLGDNSQYIIDSDGNRVEFEDPRVVFISPIPLGVYGSNLMKNVFQNYGLNTRMCGESNAEILRYAKELCSGRECLPFTMMAGALLKDLYNNRGKDEISIYQNFDFNSPCQDGAFPAVWQTFARKLNQNNVIYVVEPNQRNNYLGRGGSFGAEYYTISVVGSIIKEAENALKCIAEDVDYAMTTFQNETENIIESAKNGIIAIESACKRWSNVISEIPLKVSFEKAPKVLISGHLDSMFVDYPVIEFLLNQDVIPLSSSAYEITPGFEMENLYKHYYRQGLLTLEEKQNEAFAIISSDQSNRTEESSEILRTLMLLFGAEAIIKNYREIMGKSGLVHDTAISMSDVSSEGDKYASINGFNATPLTVGKYILSIKAGIFDGIVGLGNFTCQPAMNAQAIIRSLAIKNDVPYTTLDCEGPWISANQKRLLETVAVQAKRIRKAKNCS